MARGIRITIPNEAEVLAAAKKMRRLYPHERWETIARHFNVCSKWLRRRIDPTYDTYRRKDILGAGAGNIEPRPMSDAALKAFKQSLPPDTRDLTSRTFGDPPPGRSALDQRGGA